MKAVMYGGGNIGRGFIGMLFSKSGYKVTFIDVADKVVETLNREGRYPVRIVSNEGYEDIEVTHVDAVNGKDGKLTAETIAGADIMATAEGVNVLKYIVPNLVEGIRRRMQMNGKPLNIIICENLMDADKVLGSMIKAELTKEELRWFDENVGLVEASIGRMVPVQTEEMKAGNPLRVCVERYGFLPVDKAPFKGEIPQIENMIPFEPFDFFIRRKLYVHNMGHALCAYLGMYTHRDYIFEAMDDVNIQNIVMNAMLESALALSKKYQIPTENLVKHFQDLLIRFQNQALKDTCKRVGGDMKRKLAPEDRLIGASKLCMECGVFPVFISIGTAGAVYQYIRENGWRQEEAKAKGILRTISGLDERDPLCDSILVFYRMYLNGVSLREIRQHAEYTRKEREREVI